MTNQSRPKIRQVNHKDLPQLANLIHFETYVHRHLDYRPPLDWIDQRPFLVMELKGEVIAALACPPDPPRVAWIRLFAASTHLSTNTTWRELWSQAVFELAETQSPQWAAAIPIYNWFTYQLKRSGFLATDRIVTLNWEGSKLPEKPLHNHVNIRLMEPKDLAMVQQIDEASFAPIWQNSRNCLEYAFHQSIIATVIESGDECLGYQITTATSLGSHLTRLAVNPDVQGKGIGYALVYDLLARLMQKGTRMLTVNTQKDNLASLAIYSKAGFIATGEEYPIYQYELNRD